MIDIMDKKTLENCFAEDFNTPLFPILAEKYLSEGDIRRARMVCEVGLDYNPTNSDGRFIIARVAMIEENYIFAEKCLKQVVDENPMHFNGIRMLIRIEIKLNRSPKTIQNYINRILRFLPQDVECMQWMEQLPLASNDAAVQNKKAVNAKSEMVVPTNARDIKMLLTENEKKYNVDKSMATFTMVQVLKSQKHYNQALAVLDLLESIGLDKKKIEQERVNILQCISDFQK